MTQTEKPDMKKLTESAFFMSILTFIGGYQDAYTFITRGGVFSNNQTGNVAKLGISLWQQNWASAFDACMPLIATILGAFFAEHIKNRNSLSRQFAWQQALLRIEAVLLFAVGFVPVTVPHFPVNLAVAFIASMQLSAFRSFEGWTHNTTICTGNLRSTGQYLYRAFFVERNTAYRKKTGRYLFVFSCFVLGAVIGTGLSMWLGSYSSIVCVLPLIVLAVRHQRLRSRFAD